MRLPHRSDVMATATLLGICLLSLLIWDLQRSLMSTRLAGQRIEHTLVINGESLRLSTERYMGDSETDWLYRHAGAVRIAREYLKETR